MRQSITDNVALQIVYEGRTHNAEVKDRQEMDTAFEDAFIGYNLQSNSAIFSYDSREANLDAKPILSVISYTQ
jgi:type I restriction enzyme R subunit